MKPENGWKAQTYYRVQVSLYRGNCTHESIFYSGFLEKGEPSAYSCFLNPTYDEVIKYNSHKQKISFVEELFTKGEY